MSVEKWCSLWFCFRTRVHTLSMTLIIHSYIRQMRQEFLLVIGQNPAIRCRAAFIPDFSHCFVDQLPSVISITSVSSPQLQWWSRSPLWLFNFASASAFGAFRTLFLSTSSNTFYPLCSHSNQLTSPLVLLFHVFTSYYCTMALSGLEPPFLITGAVMCVVSNCFLFTECAELSALLLHAS